MSRLVFIYKNVEYNEDEIGKLLEKYNSSDKVQKELRKKFGYEGKLTLDQIGNLYDGKKIIALSANKKRRVPASLDIFNTTDLAAWGKVYDNILDVKYQKSKRNFSRVVSGNEYPGNNKPPIYLIARQRGGPSYKDVELVGASKEDIAFMPISKGFSMQGLSSFTLGPIVGEGLCLVNAAFSKIICPFHIVGGGKFNLSKPNFWEKGTAQRKVAYYSDQKIAVDGKLYTTKKWLAENEKLWLEEWDKWRMHVALCSVGDFHWDGGENIICYKKDKEYLSFVEWKKECYIKHAYELIPRTKEYKFIKKVWLKHRRPLGLVHPMGCAQKEAYTKEMIRELYDSNTEMSCMPFVVIGFLLGVPIYE